MTPRITMKTHGGDDIGRVSREAQAIADRIDEAVAFDFNSVRCIAEPGGSATDLADRQQKAQRSKMLVSSAATATSILLDNS